MSLNSLVVSRKEQGKKVIYRMDVVDNKENYKILQIKNPPNRKIKRVLYPKRDLNPHSREAKGF